MKKSNRAIAIPLILSILTLFSSCNANDTLFPQDEITDTNSYESLSTSDPSQTIRELEDKIIELQQSQYVSDAEQKKELERLQKLLAELKAELSVPNDSQNKVTDSFSTDTEQESVSDESIASSQFLYSKNGQTATITGYTGKDAHLVIPSEIDGYRVIGIGDSAFSSQTLKSVIVSIGIEKIDWFAFRDCPALVSVTLPDSVTSIGYSAFAPQDPAFTIYCHSNSFAHKYAKSYGWSYAII